VIPTRPELPDAQKKLARRESPLLYNNVLLRN
jgi:hypothetical protein